MGFLKRRGPNRMERLLAASSLQEAMGRVETSFADECERVRTPQGRIAHLKHPRRGVLCGWTAEWVDAGQSFPTCLLCDAELRTEDGIGEEAS